MCFGNALHSGSNVVLDPDADILKRLAAGDARRQHQALSTLMERHLQAIKSLAWYMVRDEMIAEDITQEVFIRAWKQAPKWESGGAKFSTWLYRVAKNLCYDHLRKRTEIYSDALPEPVDETPNAQEGLLAREAHAAQKTRIEAALLKLPARQLMAITLCHYQNKSQNEAAAILEVNVRAYESLLARGRQNLRLQLKAHKKDIIGDLS
ncbi:MAG: RNA polymerase sigma-70 factor [Robiginitomaculum sp.]|nr:MAG: RNA polymerase sigma-70 factor [Robiginitomaculum sp.]